MSGEAVGGRKPPRDKRRSTRPITVSVTISPKQDPITMMTMAHIGKPCKCNTDRYDRNVGQLPA